MAENSAHAAEKSKRRWKYTIRLKNYDVENSLLGRKIHKFLNIHQKVSGKFIKVSLTFIIGLEIHSKSVLTYEWKIPRWSETSRLSCKFI